jgi:adenine-specific DNA-methyltransferase
MTYRTFQKGNDTLIWGDAIEALHAIPDASVNLIFIDPPYNIGKKFAGFVDKWPSERAYLRWCFGWLRLCIQKLTADGSMYVMASTQSMPMFDLFLRRRLHILSRIVWAYDSSGVQAQRYFGSCYEPILFCVRDSKRYTFNGDAVRIEAKTGAQRKLIDYRKPDPVPYNTTKVPSNVWEMPRVRYRMEEYEEHPSQKPEALLERIIKASSNPGDLILDPFSGTFTTSAVAQRLGRRSIGIEQEEAFVRIGLRRLGIASELDGVPLAAPKKSYQRKNGKSAAAQEELFKL